MKIGGPKKIRSILKILVVIIIISFIIDYTIYLFPSVGSTLLRVYFRSPTEFNGIEVSFPKGIIYNKGDSSIGFYFWKDAFPNLLIHKMKNIKHKTREQYINHIKNISIKIIQVQDGLFQNHRSTTVQYVGKDWRTLQSICVYDLNLIIDYTGSKEEYHTFHEIIKSIKIL